MRKSTPGPEEINIEQIIEDIRSGKPAVASNSVPYWHGKEPFVEFPKIKYPWAGREIGGSYFHESNWVHRYWLAYHNPRSTVMMHDPKATHCWWDGSCLVTALAVEGPKAITLWRGI